MQKTKHFRVMKSKMSVLRPHFPTEISKEWLNKTEGKVKKVSKLSVNSKKDCVYLQQTICEQRACETAHNKCSSN